LLSPTVESLGCSIWGVEFLTQGKHSKLRLYIDRDGGVTVDDCANVSRHVSDILDVEENEAGKLLQHIDQEQRAYFKKAFGKKDASPYEFDLVINTDFISEPRAAAGVVAQAFEKKFSLFRPQSE